MASPDIFVRDFVSAGESSEDLLPALQRAAARLHTQGGGRLVFPPGIHHLRPETAEEIPLSISNNEPGFKFIGLKLHGLRDVTIIGDGTMLLIHDRLVPLWAVDCAGLRVQGLTIDWPQPFYAQAEVLSACPGEINIRLDQTLPWYVMGGRLMFCGEGWLSPLEHAFEMDTALRRPALGSHDNCGGGWYLQWHAAAVGRDCLRLRGDFPHAPKVGNALVLRPGEQRDAPAVVLNRCTNVSLLNLTIHHAGGMGVIAQRSTDLHLKNVQVIPSGDRIFSTTVDATHFVACAGDLIVEDCRFECQLDDPTNVHGIYTKIVRVVSTHTARVRLVHPQQRGFEFAGPGDLLTLSRLANLTDYWQGRVVAIRPLNRQWLDLSFDVPLPADVQAGDGVDNLSWHPKLRISRCWMSGNRARGPLLGSRKSTLIEDNTFITPGAALHSGPECDFWCESGPVSDLTIRRNQFVDCAHEADWIGAVINLTPFLKDQNPPPLSLIHRVLIEDNVFKDPNGPCVRIRHAEDITIRRNTVVRTQPASAAAVPPWDIELCSGQISITDNHLP